MKALKALLDDAKEAQTRLGALHASFAIKLKRKVGQNRKVTATLGHNDDQVPSQPVLTFCGRFRLNILRRRLMLPLNCTRRGRSQRRRFQSCASTAMARSASRAR